MDYRFESVYDRLTTLESTPGTLGFSETFDSTASTWVVVHNLDSYELIAQCWDGSGVDANRIVPADINADSNNQITIDWGGVNVGGRCTIVSL